MNKTVFIFPAFITDYTQKEIDFLNSNHIDFNHYIQRASKIIGLELPEFSYETGYYRNDELLSQIIAYLFSCAINDALTKLSIQPEYIAGYSMGIYASLYAGGSISVEDGIRLIHFAYELVKDLSQSNMYGMGAIIGLTTDDADELISEFNLKAEIINVNNQHSLVVSGIKNDVNTLLENAKKEGALSAMELTVQTPYHSKYLLKHSDSFTEFVCSISMKDSDIPVVSTFNQKLLVTAEDLRSELVINLTEKINWFKTMRKLIDLQSNIFYECGAGKDLTKIARFIEGDYKIKSIYKI